MPESASEIDLILAPTGRDAVAAEQQLREAGLESAACAGMVDLVSRLRAGAGVALVAEVMPERARASALPSIPSIASAPASSNRRCRCSSVVSRK